MSGFNQVVLMGNLTRDVELKNLPSGSFVANFGIAVNRAWLQDGEKKEEVTFVDVAAFGKTAENISKFFAKGKLILISGRLKLDQWEAQDGAKRSKLSVIAETFTFCGDKAGGSPATAGEYQGEAPATPHRQAAIAATRASVRPATRPTARPADASMRAPAPVESPIPVEELPF